MKIYDLIDDDDLKKRFSQNKKIPEQFEKSILIALSHYPELIDTFIDFEIRKTGMVPVKTELSFFNIFLPAPKRMFKVIILDDTNKKVDGILLKDLPPEARIGAIARELALIVLCRKFRLLSFVRDMLAFLHVRKNTKIEATIDNSLIQHGLATQLLEYANLLKHTPWKTIQTHEPHLPPEKITALHNQKLGL